MLACRLGRRAVLAIDPDGSGTLPLEGQERRRTTLDIDGTARFVAAVYARPPAGIDDFPDLSAFLGSADRPAVAADRLLGALLATAVPLLGIADDPSFAGELATVLDGLAEPAGAPVARLASVRDFASALILDGPEIGEDDLVFAIGERLAFGRLCLADEGGAPRAVVRFRGGVPAARLLCVAHDTGCTVRRAAATLFGDLTAFSIAAGASDPLAPSLLAAAASGAEQTRLDRDARLAARRPQPVLDAASDFGFALETMEAGSTGLFVAGWLHDPLDALVSVEVQDGSLAQRRLDRVWQSWPDHIDHAGRRFRGRRFAGFLPRRPVPGIPPAPPLTITLASGAAFRCAGLPPGTDPAARRSAVLDRLPVDLATPALVAGIFEPAAGPLNAVVAAADRVRILDSGPARPSPAASLVIPLYGTLAFVRTQLIAFAADAFLRERAEIVFVLDDPPLEDDVRAALNGAGGTLGLTIRCVLRDSNGGFGPANNSGVAAARGAWLALVNSDVIPDGPGWLEALIAAAEAAGRHSVAGPRLIAPDGALQHAGIAFERDERGLWANRHPGKGWPAASPFALSARRVQAVTGACMVLRRRDFLSVGGFTVDYAVGDYEDSDLCLKLARRGGRAVYVPDPPLHHAERQSISASPMHRRGTTLYNQCLHHARWDKAIARLVAECPETRP